MAFGYHPMLPVDYLMPVYNRNGTKQTFDTAQEYVLYLQARMKNVHDNARKSMQNAALKQRKQYNNRLKVNSYEKGDQVYYYYPVKNAGTSKESYFMWRGPYTIVSKLSDLLYRIQEKESREPFIVHHNKLKRAHCRENVNVSWLDKCTSKENSNFTEGLSNTQNEMSMQPRQSQSQTISVWRVVF